MWEIREQEMEVFGKKKEFYNQLWIFNRCTPAEDQYLAYLAHTVLRVHREIQTLHNSISLWLINSSAGRWIHYLRSQWTNV